MATTTTNYGFVKPSVNDATDADLWGGELNENFDSLDALIKTATDSPIVALTANTTIDGTYRNKVITGDATSAAFTVTLLPAATAGSGFKIFLKKIDASTNAVTIAANGAETIDGVNTAVLSLQYAEYQLVSDGTNWLKLTPVIVQKMISYNVQVFTSSGTYTPTAGMASVEVELKAPGGAGASTTAGNSSGSGGGEGGYCKKTLTAATVGSSQAVTIGSTTSFGSILSATAGQTGSVVTNGGTPTIGGAGGTASGGDINVTGEAGGWCNSGNAYVGGKGGGAQGGVAPIVLAAGASGSFSGSNGTGYGMGGGGAVGSSGTGGSGSGGLVYIKETILT